MAPFFVRKKKKEEEEPLGNIDCNFWIDARIFLMKNVLFAEAKSRKNGGDFFSCT